MSLKGNLQSVDLANVLQMLSINQKEGTLILFDGDTRKSIYFSKDGVSMLSRGRRGQDTLGRILLRYGKVTPEILDMALLKQRSENKRLGDALKRRFAGWTAYLLTGDLRLAKLIGLKPARRMPLWNGAIECRLFAFRLVEGSMRAR